MMDIKNPLHEHGRVEEMEINIKCDLSLTPVPQGPVRRRYLGIIGESPVWPNYSEVFNVAYITSSPIHHFLMI